MAHLDRALRSNLKLRHLQLLVALDEFRHLGRCAEFLSVSQPAVSRMLAEVESMLGLALFDRSTRGTEPTAAGLPVLRFARGVLAQYERTRDEIAAAASGAVGRVRVGAMPVAIPVLLPRATDSLKALSARATVLVEEGDLTRLLPKLRLGELDFLVSRLEPGYAAPDLETEALYADPMRAVVAPDHPLARKRRPGWADLAAMPCVVPPPWASLRVKLEQQCFRHGLQPSADLVESSSYLTTLAFLGQRAAAGFLAESVARHFAEAGLCHVLALDLALDVPPVGLIALRGARLGPAATQLMSCLRETAADRMMASRQPGKRPPRQH